MQPMPFELPNVDECQVMSTFQEGSASYEEWSSGKWSVDDDKFGGCLFHTFF
jgi:hypothetical protein